MKKTKDTNHEGKKPKKEKKKRTKKQLAFQIVAIIAIVFGGVAAGFYCGNLYLSTKIKTVDYSKLSEEDFLPKVDEVLSRNQGKSISEVSAIDAFVIAEHNLKNAPMFTSTSHDSLTHNYGKQSVYTLKQFYNGVYLSKDISCSSMKSIAKKIKVENGIAYVYNGEPTSETDATWSETYSEYTPEAYKEMVGLYPNAPISYIVSEQTLDPNDTAALQPGKTLANGNVQFTITLNHTGSVMNYAKKIKYMSDLSDLPSFSSLVLNFEVDKNFNFVRITSSEVYSFKYAGGIFVTCSGSITTNYDFVTIPTEN